MRRCHSSLAFRVFRRTATQRAARLSRPRIMFRTNCGEGNGRGIVLMLFTMYVVFPRICRLKVQRVVQGRAALSSADTKVTTDPVPGSWSSRQGWAVEAPGTASDSTRIRHDDTRIRLSPLTGAVVHFGPDSISISALRRLGRSMGLRFQPRLASSFWVIFRSSHGFDASQKDAGTQHGPEPSLNRTPRFPGSISTFPTAQIASPDPRFSVPLLEVNLNHPPRRRHHGQPKLLRRLQAVPL